MGRQLDVTFVVSSSQLYQLGAFIQFEPDTPRRRRIEPADLLSIHDNKQQAPGCLLAPRGSTRKLAGYRVRLLGGKLRSVLPIAPTDAGIIDIRDEEPRDGEPGLRLVQIQSSREAREAVRIYDRVHS